MYIFFCFGSPSRFPSNLNPVDKRAFIKRGLGILIYLSLKNLSAVLLPNHIDKNHEITVDQDSVFFPLLLERDDDRFDNGNWSETKL
ncbi:MAG: hypothetical protein CM1200mP10_16110 [Candidatus Neomarinimicrobiota bacterium]|nr:MAG: hypothetical protein CM1200mP10_16110 [Candidatus Neomarinimicrobiota bacterium]